MTGSMDTKYVEEALELIAQMEKNLLLMESHPDNTGLTQQIFRDMHTLKGNSAMMGYKLVADLTHQLESAYESIRSLEAAPSKNLINITLASLDHLTVLIKNNHVLNEVTRHNHEALMAKIIGIVITSAHGSGTPTAQLTVVEEETATKTFRIIVEPHSDLLLNGANPLYLLDELHSLGSCQVRADISNIPALEHCEADACYTSWEIIISAAKESDIQEVFEFVKHKCNLTIEVMNAPTVSSPNTQPEIFPNKASINNSISTIRVPAERLDVMMNLVSELITLQAKLANLADQNGQSDFTGVSENLEKISTRLRDNAFSMCLVPVENMMGPFKRLVRDLSVELNKKINFVTEGTETELDKNIMEGLSDPLMHLLRNSIDHGIELPEERRRAGKPEEGKIVLKAYCSGTNVYIEIQDDGRGMNIERIRAKAIDKGIISSADIIPDKELLNLIFLPGFSTAEQLSEISGRGVGMDVVKRKITDIRGQITINSTINKGTTIIIKLPLTVSIIDGLQVNVNGNDFLIPLSVVDKCYELSSLDRVNHFNNLAYFDDQQIPFIYLSQVLNSSEAPAAAGKEMVVVYFEDKRIGLIIDHVVGKFQAVLKSLGHYFMDINTISGATILGNGNIALVLDTNKVIEQYLDQKPVHLCQ